MLEDIFTDSLQVKFSPSNDEFYVEIKDLHDGRELAFWGDSLFAENMHKLATKFDDFDIVVNGARVLLENA